MFLCIFRQENLAAQLAKIELAQQKRDEIVAEKAAKVSEVRYTVGIVPIVILTFRRYCKGDTLLPSRMCIL